ncbi:MAG: hypothetical protein R3A79_26590 [Nannocystaceae bacterium]
MAAAKGKKSPKTQTQTQAAEVDEPAEDASPPPPPPPPARVDKPAPPAKRVAVHPDYYKELGRNQAMANGGWGAFAGGFGVSLVYALLWNGAYAIPVVGPFIGVADDDSVGGFFLGVTLGSLQLISLPIAIVGTVRKARIKRHIDEVNRTPTTAARRRVKADWTGAGLRLQF